MSDFILVTEDAVRTARLTLLPLTSQQLRWYLISPENLEHDLSLKVSRNTLTPVVRRAIGAKLSKLSMALPTDHLWYTYWLLIVTKDQFGAGLLGYKGKPKLNGEAEIGYGIDPRYRSQGYMTEAVSALVQWAFESPICRAVVAETHHPNTASKRVLEKIGMTVYRVTPESLYWRLGRPDSIGE